MASTDPPLSGSVGLDELREALSSGDPAARADAVARVRPDPGVEEALVEALDDPDPGVRRGAVRALAMFRTAITIRALMRVAAGDIAPTVRAEAVAAVGTLLEKRIRESGAGDESCAAGGR
jgi:HEAT repeat protein